MGFGACFAAQEVDHVACVQSYARRRVATCAVGLGAGDLQRESLEDYGGGGAGGGSESYVLHCMVINTNLYLLYLYIYYQSLAVDPQQ